MSSLRIFAKTMQKKTIHLCLFYYIASKFHLLYSIITFEWPGIKHDRCLWQLMNTYDNYWTYLQLGSVFLVGFANLDSWNKYQGLYHMNENKVFFTFTNSHMPSFIQHQSMQSFLIFYSGLYLVPNIIFQSSRIENHIPIKYIAIKWH